MGLESMHPAKERSVAGRLDNRIRRFVLTVRGIPLCITNKTLYSKAGLGMQMLSPTTISLPFKVLLFIMVDGWSLVISSLVRSYV